MLYVVATPIGNLEDITLRALRILKEVDLVLCEDTRVTKKLLNHYGVTTPVLSYHEHSGRAKEEKVFSALAEGSDVALVSDAGTPGISDPGGRLVAHARERFGEGVTVVAVPGPSALAAAVSVAGLPVSDFLFLGFLPHKKGRETLFKEIAASKRTVVFYESPHRLMKTLGSLAVHLASNRRIVVLKELTKIHEEAVSGTAEEVEAYFKKHSDKVRGEFVLAVGV